uniref:HORMA domain-containing protein n=1 Tax=Scleropages formosus TaxID=113540 RepID=A0A8C9V3L3_SCLFO
MTFPILKTGLLCALLSEVVTTEQQSLIAVKKLLAVAVSCITYLRGLFPEKAYGSKYKVMILREDRSCPGARQIVQWLVISEMEQWVMVFLKKLY